VFDHPDWPRHAVQTQTFRLELRHQIRSFEVQSQSLVLMEQAMPRQLLLKGGLLVVQHLSMNHPLLAHSADG
jgi:hypothetical protein